MTTSFLVSLSKRALIPSWEPTLMSTSNHLPQAPPSIAFASGWSFSIFSGETLRLQPGSLHRRTFQGQPEPTHRSPEPLLLPDCAPWRGSMLSGSCTVYSARRAPREVQPAPATRELFWAGLHARIVFLKGIPPRRTVFK